MKRINIKDIELNIDIIQLFENKNSLSTVFIDVEGNILTNKDELGIKPIIYKEENFSQYSSINDIKEFSNEIFKNYKPVLSGVTCKIKPLVNWQNIIGLNQNEMLYYDHQSDGVEIFEDSTLEDYGWHASVLEINYRTISDFIENNCEGTLLFYDNEIQFNGFAIVEDIQTVRNEVKSFIIQKAKQNLQDNICELDDDDVVEALEFFEIEV